MRENNDTAPKRIFRYAKHNSYSCYTEDVKYSKQEEERYDECVECVEYIRKDIADKEKQKIVHASQYNTDETIENNYQIGLAKGRDEREEILKPIRDVMDNINHVQYPSDGPLRLAVQKTLNLAEKAGGK
jgi:hypothetical protein